MAAPAAADDDQRVKADLARAHYDTGTGAYVRRDYTTAAYEFAEADSLAPSAVALRAALDAAILADLPPLGMELVQRSTRGPTDSQLAALVTKARTKFARRTGSVKVTCNACTARLDGTPLEPGVMRFATLGRHTVTIDRDGQAEDRSIFVEPESRNDLVIEMRAPAPTASQPTTPAPGSGPPAPGSGPPAPGSGPPAPGSTPPQPGLSPVWFIAGAGITAVLGAVTIISGVDTSNRHNDYFSRRCDIGTSSSCQQAQADGMAAQHRTNGLLAATAVAAAGTAVLGIFFVRWRSTSATVSAGMLAGGPAATLRVAVP